MTKEEHLKINERLEYLREQIRLENISYGEIAELQSLAEYIEAGDTELLEWAGVPEEEERFCTKCGKTSSLIKEEDICWTCAEGRGRA